MLTLKYLSDKSPSLTKHIENDILNKPLNTIDLNSTIYDLSYESHYAYSLLASRLRIYFLHENLKITYYSSCLLNENVLQPEFLSFVKLNKTQLNDMINLENDYKFTQNAINMLSNSYLLKDSSGKLTELPQFMWMRVAVSLWIGNLSMIKKTYDQLSSFNYIHSSPTLMNSGLKNGKLISCYTMDLKEDSIDGIYQTLHQCAILSQGGGGIGINFSQLRSNKTTIRNGHYYAKSITNPIKLYEMTAEYVDQGRKRLGAFSPYMPCWHIQIFDLIEMKNQLNGREADTAISLHYGLWISNEFMECVMNNKSWYIMCPKYYGDLESVYGDQFKDLYYKYIKSAKEKNLLMKYDDYLLKIKNGENIVTNGIIFEIKATDLWEKILQMQKQSGEPYILMKDKCNQKSNQKNSGMIKLSNICTEITLNTTKDMTSVCCLANIKLSNFTSMNKLYSMTSRLENIDINVNNNGKMVELMPTISKYSKSLITKIKNVENKIILLLSKDNEGFERAKYLFKTFTNCFNDYHYSDKILEFILKSYISITDEFKNVFKCDNFREERVKFVIVCRIEPILLSYKIKISQFISSDSPRKPDWQNKFNKNSTNNLSTFSKSIEYIIPRTADLPYNGTIKKHVIPSIKYIGFDWDKFKKIVKLAIRNLDRVLDVNNYTRPEPKKFTDNYRAVGLGIQDLGGLFIKLGIAYESAEARQLNREIMENMYYFALEASMELSKEFGSYPLFKGSPASKGLLQFDLWEKYDNHKIILSRTDWPELKKKIIKYGLRNSTVLALMPTASTGYLLGSTSKSFEPLYTNIYASSSLNGKNTMIVHKLVDDLEKFGLWSNDMFNAIIENGGKLEITDNPISNNLYLHLLKKIPQNLKDIYKTSYDISMKTYIDMAVERGWFVCQSQSLNLYPKKLNIKYLNSLYFYAYKSGLKTLCYYLKNGSVHRTFQASTKKINFKFKKFDECVSCQ
jgi:ribonucleotide reductase alpha subunit